MSRLIPLTLLALFTGSTLLFAMNEFEWGGPGYDPALKNSSRFSARHDVYHKNENLVEILVDSQKTVEEVGEIRLVSSNGQEASSAQCGKAMKHITAPWACSFRIDDIKRLAGQGKIIVKNRHGDTLISDSVDLDNLSSLAADPGK